MIQSISSGRGAVAVSIKRFSAFLLLAGIMVLPGCGSTKVYTADKTLVYGSSLYNLSNVQRLGSRVEGTLENGDKVEMENMGKKEVNDLLDKQSSFVVATYIEMDQKDFIYQNSRIDSYSDFSKMVKRHKSAMGDIQKFMANKKSTQLKLR